MQIPCTVYNFCDSAIFSSNRVWTSIWEPYGRPKALQYGLISAQDDSKTALGALKTSPRLAQERQIYSTTAPRAPKTSPRAPKTHSRPFQERPRLPQERPRRLQERFGPLQERSRRVQELAFETPQELCKLQLAVQSAVQPLSRLSVPNVRPSHKASDH